MRPFSCVLTVILVPTCMYMYKYIRDSSNTPPGVGWGIVGLLSSGWQLGGLNGDSMVSAMGLNAFEGGLVILEGVRRSTPPSDFAISKIGFSGTRSMMLACDQ